MILRDVVASDRCAGPLRISISIAYMVSRCSGPGFAKLVTSSSSTPSTMHLVTNCPKPVRRPICCHRRRLVTGMGEDGRLIMFACSASFATASCRLVTAMGSMTRAPAMQRDSSVLWRVHTPL